MLGVDRNSIRRWMKDHPPDDDWQVVEAMAGAQLMERMAKGEIRSPRDLAIIKGIAGRNIRAKELIARREARREDAEKLPEPSPMRKAVDRLDNLRGRLFADEIRLALARREAGLDPTPTSDPEADHDATLIAFVDELLALTDAEVEERTAALSAERLELDRIRNQQEAARRPGPRGFETAVDVTPKPRLGTRQLLEQEGHVEEGERGSEWQTDENGNQHGALSPETIAERAHAITVQPSAIDAQEVDEPPPDTAEGVLVDVGQPWQWRPYDR
jgi:hypothetical protein